MGLSSSKSKTKSTSTADPSAYAKPFITDAATTLRPGFDAATANNATLQPRVNDALNFAQGTMDGQFLDGNPHLQGVIDAANRDTNNAVSSRFEGAGRYGSGNYADVLSRALLDNETKLRYGDYAQERAYQAAAPGQLASLTGVSAALPQAAGSTYADQIRALLGQYNTTSGTSTTKSSPSIGAMLMQAAANAAQAYAAGG